MPNPSLSVSELNNQVKLLLEGNFGEVWVRGEISSFSAYERSGHWYFSLKDDQAQVQCAMFASANKRCQRPKNGDQVQVSARVSLYSPRGNYQLICQSLQHIGQGLLMQQFLMLKERLKREGLFDAERKTSPPERLAIGHVAVVTSRQGAAVRDVLKVLANRMPAIAVSVVDSPVQGEAASARLIQALRYADSLRPDVLLLTRGGGSLEDLWCFNDEQLVRALAACQSFTMSAIGHETDQSLCDFAADRAAPTPSAAAAVIALEASQLAAALQERDRRLRQLLRLQLDSQWQRLDNLEQRLRANSPISQLATRRNQLEQQQQRLHYALQRRFTDWRHRLDSLQNRLEAVNPQAVLQRGYALIYDQQGRLLSNPAQAQVGQAIEARWARGRLAAQVTAVEPET